MTEDANVVGFPPKIRNVYRDHEIVLQFDTITHNWTWLFTHISTTQFKGTAPTIERALKDARKQVDILTGMQHVSNRN